MCHLSSKCAFMFSLLMLTVYLRCRKCLNLQTFVYRFGSIKEILSSWDFVTIRYDFYELNAVQKQRTGK